MNKVLLFIYEGEKAEVQIFDKLKEYLFQNEKNYIIHICFKNNIYNLYDKMKKIEFVDTLGFIQENSGENDDIQKLELADIAGTFLFFDYDGQHDGADDSVIKEMLDFFNDEYDTGKLYISYPMIEAIKDYNKEIPCIDRCLSEAKKTGYKSIVNGRTKYQQFSKIDKETWAELFLYSLCKVNCLVNDSFNKPTFDEATAFTQDFIFEKQLEKYIVPHNKVLIHSSIPLFFIDYFNTQSQYDKIIGSEELVLPGCNST